MIGKHLIVLESLRTLPKLGLTAAFAGPIFVLRETRPIRDAAGELVGELVTRTGRTAGEAAVATAHSGVRVARVLRNAGAPRPAPWRAGHRLHFPLQRIAGQATARDAGRRLAAAVAEHPDVLAAYWDGGLGSLIVHLGEDAAADRVAGWIGERVERHGLAPAEPDSGVPHPGDTLGVRTAIEALVMDGAGLAVAVGARTIRARRAHDWMQAAVTALREHPTMRSVLNERFGWSSAELARAAANATARGLSQSPTQLVLDVVLRSGQLVEAIARVAAFDAAHDELCSPRRPSMAVSPEPREARIPVEDYASGAVDGGLLGALAALVLRRDPREAANAVLAASPLPARYTHTAFHAGLGTALAREGVLVRDPDRLKSLDAVDTVVLDASALRDAAGLDPHAEAMLHAARRAELRVLITGTDTGGELAEFATLADDLVTGESLAATVRRLRDEDRVVLTIARPPAGAGPHSDEVTGLLAGDVCVSITDRDAPVLWGADLLVHNGPTGAWRVLNAVAAARANSHRATRLAAASALLGGLLLLAGKRRGRPRTLLPRLPQLDPVAIGGIAGIALGWGTALRVAGTAPPPGQERVAWHELTAEEAVRRLRAGHAEPTPLERAIGKGQAMFGALAAHPVAIPVRYGADLAVDVAAELNDPLTPVLALGAIASAVIGSPVDAALVAAAIGLNAFVGGTQRFRGRRALARLQAGERQKARKLRNGKASLTDARDLVPGDLIELRVGDVVPADARLTEVADLEVDESALTGESLPVSKQLDPRPGAGLVDRDCLVFAGTSVVSGEGRAVVTATGQRTVSGRAVNLAARTPPSAGIQARLHELTRKAMPLTIGGGALVTALSAIRGNPMRRAVAGGVAIAVAAVPEGLPLVATVAQLAAARRLSTRDVLVRSPRALEALGRLDTMCFDKTGTLTENRLRVAALATARGETRPVDDESARPVLIAAARSCPKSNGRTRAAHAHATDHAILEAAGPDTGWTQLAGQPFEASRGYSATIGRDGSGRRVLLVKGAPEIVLPACGADRALVEAGEALADNGLRVIAVAERELPEGADTPALGNGDGENVLADLGFLGFVGLADLPRDGAASLVAGLREAGIAPIMLTGDHPHTARAIATGLGWPADTPVVTGDELAGLDRASRARVLSGAGVIARVAPEQKLQVVEALREAGRVTAMVGDGANDAAAIRAANVGIGVRARASTAARTAADLALAGDDLTVLLEAVAEGRALWRSVSDAVTILIGGNAGEVGFSVLGTLIGGASPLSTRQFLLVNLLTDLFPAMAVAVTRPDDTDGTPAALGDALTRDIRNRGISTGVGATTAWLVGRFTPGTARRTSTMALCGLVGAQLAQTLRGRWHSPLVLGTAAGSAVALGAIVQTPVVSHFFGCTPLGPVAWTGVAGGVATATATSLLPPLRTRR